MVAAGWQSIAAFHPHHTDGGDFLLCAFYADEAETAQAGRDVTKLEKW